MTTPPQQPTGPAGPPPTYPPTSADLPGPPGTPPPTHPAPTTGPAPKPLSARTAILIGTGLVLALLGLESILTSDSEPAPDTAAPPYTTPALDLSHTTPVHPPRPAQDSAEFLSATTIPTWYTAGGQTYIDDISADATAIYQATQAHDTPAMVAACNSLHTDAVQAQHGPPIPDPEAQRHWSAALDHYQQAAIDCRTGGTTGNSTLILAAAHGMQQGTTQAGMLTARIREMNTY